MHNAPSKTDTRRLYTSHLWYFVLPIFLRFTQHHKKTSLIEYNLILFNFFLSTPKLEKSLRSKADDCDWWIDLKMILIITMPCHSFFTSVIEIKKTGIKTVSCLSFEKISNCSDRLIPWARNSTHSRVVIIITLVSVPCDFTFCNDSFSVYFCWIMYPWDFMIEILKECLRGFQIYKIWLIGYYSEFGIYK